MKNKNDFEFSYSAPTSEERKEIESIKRSYLKPSEKESKISYLRKLDNKVKEFPPLIALIVGIIGILIFGTGLTMVLLWNLLAWGIVVCIIGAIPVALAYPAYIFFSKKMREKYSDEIIKLSDELLDENN